jgi:cysteine desulfurase
LRAYLDHASTSPLRPAARDALLEWLSCADPGRVHTEGRMARAALEEARESVAALLGTRPRQVIFTSGGTEAVNAAVFAALWGRPDGRAVVPGVEHSAVREACLRWSSEVIWTKVGPDGRADLSAIREAVAEGGVGLVNCQAGNHEVGTLQPVEQLAGLLQGGSALLHVDAAAAAGHVPLRFDGSGIDLMSVSAHKLGGPAGVGALLVRRGLRLPALLVGGEQERARRAGLENVAAAAGFGAAAAELASTMAPEEAEARRRTDRLREAARGVAGAVLQGPAEAGLRLPHIVCLTLPDVEAEPILVGLDRAGVAAHSGSSCSSESLEPSPVLAAMGADAERSLRLSVGWSTTDAEVDLAARALPEVVAGLRALRGS